VQSKYRHLFYFPLRFSRIYPYVCDKGYDGSGVARVWGARGLEFAAPKPIKYILLALKALYIYWLVVHNYNITVLSHAQIWYALNTHQKLKHSK